MAIPPPFIGSTIFLVTIAIGVLVRKSIAPYVLLSGIGLIGGMVAWVYADGLTIAGMLFVGAQGSIIWAVWSAYVTGMRRRHNRSGHP